MIFFYEYFIQRYSNIQLTSFAFEFWKKEKILIS